LHQTERIKSSIEKLKNHDNIVFGYNRINYKNWQFGITDLITKFAESNSQKVKPSLEDCKILQETLTRFQPRTAVILHGKVLDTFITHLGYEPPESNSGYMGELIDPCTTSFFNIAFPHGNTITSKDKIKRYRELMRFLEKNAP